VAGRAGDGRRPGANGGASVVPTTLLLTAIIGAQKGRSIETRSPCCCCYHRWTRRRRRTCWRMLGLTFCSCRGRSRSQPPGQFSPCWQPSPPGRPLLSHAHPLTPVTPRKPAAMPPKRLLLTSSPSSSPPPPPRRRRLSPTTAAPALAAVHGCAYLSTTDPVDGLRIGSAQALPVRLYIS
jgi:hypothetical protein